MEENKDLKNEEIKEENLNEKVNKDTVLQDNENLKDDEKTTETVTDKTDEVKEEDEFNMSKKLKEENKKLQEELDSVKDKVLRLTAEYENYRKRTAKEKEGIYADAYVDVIKEILPIIDNLERAIAAEGNVDDLKKGVEMTMKGCQDSFAKLGIEEIDASGEFDPNFHNAVMHIEDENLDKNVIAEVFQKGYKKGEKIIRYTMVKVAN